MIKVRPFAPARIRRAFFVLAFFGAAALPGLHAQPGYRPSPDFAKSGKPDQAEGQRILEEFRNLGIAGDYFLEFQLRVMPRRGDERTYAGRLWGARNERGGIVRVTLAVDGAERRLLLQDGREPAVWSWRTGAGTGIEKLDVAALFSPLAATDLTPFDLERPYLYWTDFAFEGVVRIRGRPTYQFLVYPPVDFATKYPALTGVRLYLDTQFRQPVQCEQIGAGGRLLKSMTVQELKKIGEQWIPKSVDLRDETTHNKTRFLVTGAALGQDFARRTFSPSALADDLQSPPTGHITKVAP
ncbi:MAG: outer membrane lipoprotein-sorting protein [Opitutaceae bacterium]|nr:outer membrane lipoprotein-sorting protein [Opitutaceae bacterium]